MTPLIRALRRRHPDARITAVTRAEFAPLLAENPRLSEVIGWERGSSLRALGARLRAGLFTHRLDLHGSLRSRALRWHAGGRWSGYPKHRLARAVLIRTKRDTYRDRRPIAERYFVAARGLAVTPAQTPPDLFPSARPMSSPFPRTRADRSSGSPPGPGPTPTGSSRRMGWGSPGGSSPPRGT